MATDIRVETAPAPVEGAGLELVKLPTGETLDTAQVAAGSLDRVLRGYLETAKALGSELAADLYKRANPNSTFTANWFERHKHLG